MENKEKFPTVKDYIYLIIIIVIIFILLGANFFGASSSLANKLNFTATVTSIILAILAIVFPLIENSNIKQTNIILRQTSKDIKKANKSLQDNSSIINESVSTLNASIVQLQGLSERLNDERILSQIDSLRKEMANQSIITVKQLSDIMANTYPKAEKNSVDISFRDIINNKDVIKGLIQSVSPKCYRVLYLAYKLLGENFGRKEFIKKTTSFLQEESKNANFMDLHVGINVGLIRQLIKMGLIILSEPVEMSDVLKEIIQEQDDTIYAGVDLYIDNHKE